MPSLFKTLFFVALLLISLSCKGQKTTVQIEDLGKNYRLQDQNLLQGLYHHIEKDDDVNGGNTSLRNCGAEHLEWKGNPNANGYGYFQRNRDLGQVFNVPENKNVTIDALVLRTSRGNNAVMKGTPTSEVYIAFYEVIFDKEELKINENGTTKGDRATHGFDHQFNRADDFIEGAEYRFLQRFNGGIFPNMPVTDQYVYDSGKGKPFGEQEGHLRFFRCDFKKGAEITLEGGKTYAFLIGFTQPGDQRGLALAIGSEVHAKEPAEFVTDELGKVKWGIRREGNGTLPPTTVSTPQPPTDEKLLGKLIQESLFPENHFESLPPTSEGYPDVDTYRTLQFYLEIRNDTD